MDKKTFAIGILSLMSVILFVGNLMPIQPAMAAEVIKDRDYQLVTSRIQQGGEALYVLDNRTGLVAVFSWDAQDRIIRPRAVRAISIATGG